MKGPFATYEDAWALPHGKENLASTDEELSRVIRQLVDEKSELMHRLERSISTCEVYARRCYHYDKLFCSFSQAELTRLKEQGLAQRAET
mgnify:FL=1